MTILEKIIANKKNELALLRDHTSIRDLEKSNLFSRKTLSLSKFLTDPLKTGIIAEFKRRSPSKGLINSVSGVGEVTRGYAREGASGLSVLTDMIYFGGSSNDLTIARELNSIPILRKDFIVDELQVVESKASGADALLLIAAALEREQIHNLAILAHSLGMEVLLEVHSPAELELVNQSIDIIGVNNRDLNTFRINTNISLDLADKIPGQFLKISESGITAPSLVRTLRQAGYNGFLIGELFMSGNDPVTAFSEFVKNIKSNDAES
ncbi:MAG: indole-3-glycerol phosphate synthase TrpC [Bacteroidales bacterium]|nr:indole-3-glycerol phosphate synthase TrpC [Bacteroidales bacterium]